MEVHKPISDRDYYGDINAYLGVTSLSRREIEYQDVKPRQITVQIPLVDYFERVKRYKADRFQRDLCGRLQTAAETRHIKRTWEIFHAESQLGKTSVLTQTYSAWLFGHDPLFRYALMMFNVTRAQEHSEVVISIMNSPTHKGIFPNKDGWLESNKPSKAGWFTRARKELGDAQFSFNPCGLVSGLTGSGFDFLGIDDPYANESDAFSPQINLTMQNRYRYTVVSRAGLHSNIAGMFHRYAPDDYAGFMLDTGDFDYIRYASQADGDYIHTKTGKRYPDPLNRQIGEYISPKRRPPEYYAQAKKDTFVWLSMFQGRPSSESGGFFQIDKIRKISKEESDVRRRECLIIVTGWDLAATAAGGAYTVGGTVGLRTDGSAVVFEIVRKQVDPAASDELMKRKAASDGADVIITIPNDPGAAGNRVVFNIKQMLRGFQVVERSTSGSKEDRARLFAKMVNSGMVEFVDDAELPPDGDDADVTKWNEIAKNELRDFPRAILKDIVDALSDAYSEAHERLVKGLVMANYKQQRNLVAYSAFANRFPFTENNQLLLKIPQNWQIYVALKISADASRPTCGIITARASENSGLGETIIGISEYKKYDGSYENLLSWLKNSLAAYCLGTTAGNTIVWLHPDSAHFEQTIIEKMNVSVAVFDGDELAGLAEANWYLMPKTNSHPFNALEYAAGLYLLVQDDQFNEASGGDYGFYHARQEAATWGYNEKGEPTKIGAVLDCLRICVAGYATHATPLTQAEVFERRLKERLPVQMQGEVVLPDAETVGYNESLTLQMNQMFLRREMREEGVEFETPFDDEDDSGMSGGW